MTAIVAITQELRLNLEEQVRVWRRLLDLSQAQLAALREQDVHSVHAILQEIEIAMLERSRTEVRRALLIEQAAVVLGISSDEVTRDVLVGHSDAAIGEALARAADELQMLVGELDQVVMRNRAMLEQELGIIDTIVQGMTVDRTAQPMYGRTGMQSEAPRLRLLDAQV